MAMRMIAEQGASSFIYGRKGVASASRTSCWHTAAGPGTRHGASESRAGFPPRLPRLRDRRADPVRPGGAPDAGTHEQSEEDQGSRALRNDRRGTVSPAPRPVASRAHSTASRFVPACPLRAYTANCVVLTLGVDRDDHRLAAIPLCQSGDQVRVAQSGGIQADLVGACFDRRRGVFFGADAAADRERQKNLAWPPPRWCWRAPGGSRASR